MKVAFGISTSVALCTAALIGSGTAWAGAPNVVGQKYSDAQQALSGAGYKAVVSTTVGDRKNWSDCLVTNQVARTVAGAANSGGSGSQQVLISLNCENIVADAGHPGNSAGSPMGSQAAAALTASAASAAAAASASAEAEASAAAAAGG